MTDAGAAATNANTEALNANTEAREQNHSDEVNGGSALLRAVEELTTVVRALQETMKEYPNRRELKLNYATRREISARRKLVVTAMVVAIILSYFFTIGSVSYCFLSGVPEPGTHRFCRIFPGYEKSFDNNRENIKIFVDMQEQIKRNQVEIQRLQEEIESANPTDS